MSVLTKAQDGLLVLAKDLTASMQRFGSCKENKSLLLAKLNNVDHGVHVLLSANKDAEERTRIAVSAALKSITEAAGIISKMK